MENDVQQRKSGGESRVSWVTPLAGVVPEKKPGYIGKPSVARTREIHAAILRLKADGRNRFEIAEILGITGQAVWRHLTGKIKCVSDG